MTESKTRAALRLLVTSGGLADLPDGLDAHELAAEAEAQGVTSLLLAALEAGRQPLRAEGVLPQLQRRRRARLAASLGQIALLARVLDRLNGCAIRALPLKGAVLAESVYDLESDRPMTDVDLIVLERWADASAELRAGGLEMAGVADHAVVLRENGTGRVVELHRSITTAPGLYPIDREGLWRRRRAGLRQLPVWPSAEDLLVQLALHAAFQHGLVLSLVQWLDFRRLLEREAIDSQLLWEVAAASRAEAPLGAALLAARVVVGAPLAPPLEQSVQAALPNGLRRWLEPRLAAPSEAFVQGGARVELARVRYELLAGRRLELLRRTLLLPATPSGDTRVVPRLRHAAARLLRIGSGVLRSRTPAVSRWHAAGQPRVHQPTDSGERSRTSSDPGSCPREPASLPPSIGDCAESPNAPSARQMCGQDVPFPDGVLSSCLDGFDAVRFEVTGRCMEPAIGEGDRVLLVAPARRRPRIGDVVLVRQQPGLRLHRLVWGPPLAPAGLPWRTRADAGLLLDPPFAARDVLATVAAIEGRAAARPRHAGRAFLSLVEGLLAGVRWRLGNRRSETPGGSSPRVFASLTGLRQRE